MPEIEPTQTTNPETSKNPDPLSRLTIFALRKYGEVKHGHNKLPARVKGLCEDAILSPRLCSPDESNEHLSYHHARAGQWISHDFRRGEFYPEAVDEPWFTLHKEGTLSALVIDGIADIDPDVRTDLPTSEWLNADTLLSFDKPGIERLLELGMVARRSHELAYEAAGQEVWIDDLRSRGLAQDPVYQVAPKAHSLILITKEGGKKTPKTKPVHLPSMIHSPVLACETHQD